MILYIFLFCLAVCVGAYGAFSGSLLSLTIAAILTVVVAEGVRQRLTAQSSGEREESFLTLRRYAGLSLVALAIFVTALATRQAQNNEFDFTPGYLWLAGMVLLLVAGHTHDQWLLYLQGKRDQKRGVTYQFWRIFDRTDWLLVLAITLVALVLRLYRLNDFLPTMHGDEGEMGELALLALYGPASKISPNPLPFFSTAFLDHPTLFHYLQAGALWLFGESLTGLRTLSVVFGALCVPPIYAIGRLGWGRIAAVSASWLLAVSHLHIQYSRIALNNIETVWFVLLFILCMIIIAYGQSKAHTDNSQADPARNQPQWIEGSVTLYLWAGLAMGLSQYFYYGSRLIPILALPLLLFLWVTKRAKVLQIVVMAIATLIAYAPLAAHYSHSLAAFVNRTRGVSIFNAEGMAHTLGPQAVWPRDLPLLFWEQLRRNALFLVQNGDTSSFYLADIPAFDPITVTLFWLGLGVVLTRIRRFYEFSLVIWLGLGIFFAGILTNDAPNGPRLIVAIIPVYLFGGIFLQRLTNLSKQVWPTTGKWTLLLTGALCAAAVFRINFTTYFDRYAQHVPNTMPISMAHDIVKWEDYRTYLFGAPNFYADYGVLRFVARSAERHNANQIDDVELAGANDPTLAGTLIIALPHRLGDLAQVEERYPGGIPEDRFNPYGQLMYAMYRVPNPAWVAPVPTPAADGGNAPVSPLAPPSP
ncbi:MAG: glycosyltransferase family 39 protein [Caldilineaceae bacterium]